MLLQKSLQTLLAPLGEVRATARTFLVFAAILPVVGVFAYAFDGIYIGALWSRDMRNLMLGALAIYLAAWAALRPLGNDGLWLALLAVLLARGLLAPQELPVGVLTAVLGGGYLLWLMHRRSASAGGLL